MGKAAVERVLGGGDGCGGGGEGIGGGGEGDGGDGEDSGDGGDGNQDSSSEGICEGIPFRSPSDT